MVKRITVSVPDELYEKIQSAKQGFSKEFSVSKIVQQALKDKLEYVQRRAAVWQDGFLYGENYIESLSDEERRKAKKMVANFPRKYPKEIIDVFMKAGLINQDTLKKHFDILHYWKVVHERFEFIEGLGDVDEWDEWIGTPPVHDGVDIYETGIDDEMKFPDGRIFPTTKSAAGIRYEQIIELWRKGLLTGIKEATKSIEEEAGNEND